MDDQNNGLYRGAAGEALRFFTRAIKNNFQSEQAGHPVYDTGLFVEIITPGSTSSVPEKLIERTGKDAKGKPLTTKTADYERFKAQVEAYKGQTGEHLADGMPITQWAQIDAGTAQTLKAQGIHTVEALAEVGDGHLANLGTGGMHLREQAKAFIVARQFGVPIAQQSAETSKLREDFDRVTNERDEALEALRQANARIQAFEQGTNAGTSASLSQPNADANLNDEANKLSSNDAGKSAENMAGKNGAKTPKPPATGDTVI